MSFWGKLALVAAGTVIGAAAARITRTPGQDLDVRRGAAAARAPRPGDWRSRLYRFAATVKAGMDEREAELRASFGVTPPGTPSSPLTGRDAAPGLLDAPDPSTDREGKHR
ncbi:hypothetical protein [Kocuria rosea]|uniref:hypothetical protein n=1 Tax=Kocuria rosea TaxID=1275 RepID=UPI00203BB658|nr:hypothetical protein [Kocuria rosea]MCM3687463.1 hypothetical protein [Kocuria rosea]